MLVSSWAFEPVEFFLDGVSQEISDCRNERADVFPQQRGRLHGDHGKRKCRQILLEFEVLVGCEEDIELGCGTLEQASVRDSAPLHFWNGLDLMAGKFALQSGMNTLIQQDSHLPFPLRYEALPRALGSLVPA